ncbi:MAG: hypothetical protein V3T81_07880 [Thermoanaerobaculia bacterium]
MLFIVDDQGVPSVAPIVRIGLGAEIFSDGFESGDTSGWSGSSP